MQASLYEQLLAIDSIPEYVEVDRPKEFREVFDEWKERSGLVKRAIEGELTLTQDFEELREKLGWVKDFYPHTIDDELKERVRGYEEITIDLGQNDGVNLIANPVTLSGGAGLIGSAVGSTLIDLSTSRRGFVKGLLLGGFSGGVLGIFGPFGKFDYSNRATKQVSYLQQKIDEYSS